MKKIYSWVAVLFIATASFAQSNLPLTGNLNVTSPFANRDFSEQAPTFKFTQCTDTVYYVPFKDQTGPNGVGLNNSGTFIEEAFQAYRYDNSNAAARIIGVEAWVVCDTDGIPGSTPDIPVNINVSSVDGNNAPVSQMYSESYIVPDAAGFATTTYMFSNPVNISGSFAVSFEIGSAALITDTLLVLSTGDGDGLGENLSYVDFPINGGILSIFNDFAADLDVYIMPIMEYDLHSDFYLYDNCLEFGDDVYTNNMSEVVGDYMFNAGMILGGNPISWDFGDGNTTSSWDDQNNYAAPGYYEVTLSDTLYGWTATCGEAYSEWVSVMDAQLSVTDATCGINDGAASITGFGGVTPYSYMWIDQSFNPTGETDQMLTGLAPGLYIAQVFDNSGCDVMTGNTLSNSGAPSVTVTSTPETCSGTSDGMVSVAATGGATPYSYSWFDVFMGQPAGTSTTVTGLGETVLSVSVVDAAGCMATSIGFTQSPNGALDADTWSQDVSTMGGSDGEVYVSSWGGVSPYSYMWSNGSTDQYQSGLMAGTYNVTVTDQNGCEAYDLAIVNEPNACGFIYNYDLDPEDCGNEDGSIYNTWINGGVGPFDYMWDNGQTTNDRYGLENGDYYVTITDQGTACFDVMTITVPGTDGVDFYITTTDATCGASDGSASAVILEGQSPYSYTWMDGNFNPTGATTQTVTGLPASVVLLQVIDGNGCDNFNGNALNNAGAPTVSMTFNDVTCNGDMDGEVSVSATGGSTPYNFDWSELNSGTSFGSGQTLTGLGGGVYVVTVTDAAGCVSLGGGDVQEPSVIGFWAWVNNASSPGASDGDIDLAVWGGTGSASNYTYNWSNGISSEDQFGIPAGYYNVTVTDSLGCTNDTMIFVDQPGGFCGLTITTTQDQPVCNGSSDGELSVSSVSNGLPPFSYAWSTGGTDDFETGLASGIYDVTVTDDAGCTITESLTLTDPVAMVVSVTSNPDMCGWGDGNASASVSNGSFPYVFDWSNGDMGSFIGGLEAGSYDVTVTDDDGCEAVGFVTVTEVAGIDSVVVNTTDAACGASDGSATVQVYGGTSPFIYVWFDSNFDSLTTGMSMTGLSAGTYIALAVDDNGCDEANGNFVNNTGAPTITTVTSTDETCAGYSDGSVSVEATGGVTPYTYTWIEFQSGATYSGQTVSGLPAGDYLVTVSDAQVPTCIASMYIEVEGSDSIYVSEWVSDAWCNGSSDGEVYLDVWDGNSPYSYEWSNGELTEDITGLEAGTYSVTVTDANGCEYVDSYDVDEPIAISLSITSNDATCGNSDGDATVNAADGVGTYYFDWSDGQSSQTANNLMSGVYDVTVSDDNGCESVGSVAISNSNGPQVTVTSTDVTCNGDMDGSVSANVVGGTSPYTYLWSGGATSASVSGLAGGQVTITVTDGTSCEGYAVASITEPEVVSINVSATDVTCNGESDGTALASADGGDGNYTYTWSDGQSGVSVAGLAAGTYGVTVEDGNSCESTGNVIVSEPSALSVTTSWTNTSASGSSDGTGTATVAGGTAPYSYIWSNGEAIANATGLAEGTHSVTVSDDNGCEVVGSVTVTVTGVTEVVMNASFKLFPNPNSGLFVVEVSQHGNYSVVVRNVIGQQIEAVRLNGTRKEINLQEVESGVYFVTIVGEGYERTEKIIVR